MRESTQKFFGFVEDVLYVLVASALALVGLALFVYVIYDFIKNLDGATLTVLILELLDGLLLVFIITELIHTVRAIIDEKVLVSEPFLVVGVVALIRRLVIVSAEAKNLFGKPEFTDALQEIGVLTVGVVLLGLTIFMLRRTEHSEPRPGHEPD
jgi:uncharacterized membrane protein (DUF373 family)